MEEDFVLNYSEENPKIKVKAYYRGYMDEQPMSIKSRMRNKDLVDLYKSQDFIKLKEWFDSQITMNTFKCYQCQESYLPCLWVLFLDMSKLHGNVKIYPSKSRDRPHLEYNRRNLIQLARKARTIAVFQQSLELGTIYCVNCLIKLDTQSMQIEM